MSPKSQSKIIKHSVAKIGVELKHKLNQDKEIQITEAKLAAAQEAKNEGRDPQN
jgi:hypothetical protein